MHNRKLYNSDWKMIEERIEKKLVGKGNTYLLAVDWC
jgi:hypothetical protein